MLEPLELFGKGDQVVARLINLDIGGNPVNEAEDYRRRMFEMLPGLEVLDGCDPEGNEVNSENDQEAEEYDIGDRADGGDVISSQDEEDDEEDEEEEEGGMYSSDEEEEQSEESESQSGSDKEIEDNQEEEEIVFKKRVKT